MRTVTYGAACSLDGFIAGPQGEIDWLHMSSDVSSIMAKYWKSVDTILMGRKTYDVAQQMGGGPAVPGISGTYVFSRTLDRVAGAELVRDDAGAFVRSLKDKPGKDICLLGGGELARSLLAEGVIDEVGLNIYPILLGGGYPLFPDIGKRIELELIENRTIEGGCVLASYRVVH
jgi:dihydrofolate reductase